MPTTALTTAQKGVAVGGEVRGWGATVTHEGLTDLEDERTYAVSYDEGGTMTALTGEALKRHCSFSFACVWIPGMKVLITHCYCMYTDQ
jgi:hypothetical protein